MLLLKGKLRLFIIFSLCTFAAQAEDLWDIYNLAKENDTQFLANTAQWQASKETLNQNKALIMPSLDLSASVSGNRQKTRQPSASAGILNYDSEVYSISLIQPLYNSEYMARIHQAQAVVDQADADFESARLELMVRVAEKYFSVLSAGDNVAFAEAEKKAVERQLEQTQKRFEVGLIAITDVHEAKARYDITVAQEIAARNDLADSYEALYEITGQYHKQISILNDNVPLVTPEPKDINGWTSIAMEKNLSLISARKALASAEQEIKKQQAGHYPSLSIVGNKSYSDKSNSSLGATNSETDSIGLQLDMSLFAGGKTSSLVRQSTFLKVKAQEEMEKQRRSALRQTREAYLGLNAAISRVNALKQALTSSESALEATEAGFEVGTRTIVDVLLALREKYRAQRDYAQSRYDYVIETLHLKQAAGVLSDSDIEMVNSWLVRK